MDKRSIDTIDYLANMLDDPQDEYLRHHESLWQYAALLDRVATVEGLQISEEVNQMLNFFPDGVDVDFAEPGAPPEEARRQAMRRQKRREELIRILKFHIDEFDRIAEEQGAYNYNIKKGAASGEQATPQGDAKS